MSASDQRFDTIIVGGGSAGCVLAARLSANPGQRVLVLEAGRRDSLWDIFIHMPAGLTYPIGSRFYDWRYQSEPEPFMHNRRIAHGRGKLLGGSSSINGMIFQRGNPLDYEKWGNEPGMAHWDYAHCLPYFKRMETSVYGSDEFRGHNGPLVLERGAANTPLFAAFFAVRLLMMREGSYDDRQFDELKGYATHLSRFWELFPIWFIRQYLENEYVAVVLILLLLVLFYRPIPRLMFTMAAALFTGAAAFRAGSVPVAAPDWLRLSESPLAKVITREA